MQVVMFYHSLVSDWNHGNAHFLRGVATELTLRGHDVRVYEPENAWSVQNLVAEFGEQPLRNFEEAYPQLKTHRYSIDSLDLNVALRDADLVIVHEWNSHDVVRLIGEHHASSNRGSNGGYTLLFHDTHHRAVTKPEQMKAYNLEHYDGVLAFGKAITDIYLDRGWTRRAWTWHEAADTRVFHPVKRDRSEGDVVWIGNWGDEERTAELDEFLLEPVRDLGLKGAVYGVRYPEAARQALASAGIEYRGWLPNYKAPEVFARFKVTVHIPRRPYVNALPGIPTIRPFEALACGIPLISSPWHDVENLFTAGCDYLVAADGEEMKVLLKRVLNDESLSRSLSEHGLATILARHTCAHRVDQLMQIQQELVDAPQEETVPA